VGEEVSSMPHQRRGPEREHFWREAVAAQRKAGLSVSEFCRERGLSQASFYAWRRRLTRQEAGSPPPKFVPVTVVSESMIEVMLAKGMVVRVPPGSEPVAVARLVAALEAAPC
jgi:transposase-like protein